MNDLSMDDLRQIEEELFPKAAAGSHGSSIQFDDLDEQTNPIGVDFDFNVNDTNGSKPKMDTLRSSFDMPDEIRREIDCMERQFLREQFVATARGSQIGVFDESGGRYCGTVLHAGPDRLELMNCLSQEAIPGPDGQLQCKKSHIPFLTIETSAVIHFVTIAPPPPNFPKTDEEIDPSDYSVAEIVNRSGQRHRWGRVPVPANADEAFATVE